MRSNAAVVWMLLLLPGLAWTAEAQRSYPIAGLAPDARPANAPQLTKAAPIARRSALHGVSEPLPPSLSFLDHQGGWYNPFLHPGMTGRYDLRGWHTRPGHGEKRR